MNNRKSTLYAFGLEVGLYKNKKAITHNGRDPGYKAEIPSLPEEELTVICLSNAENTYGMTAKLFHVAESLIPFDRGGVTNMPVTDESNDFGIPLVKGSAPDSPTLKSFAGAWYSPELDATYHFFEKDGNLYLKFFDAYEVSLSPFANYVFTADFLGTNIIQFVKNNGETTMEFSRDEIYKLRFTQR